MKNNLEYKLFNIKNLSSIVLIIGYSVILIFILYALLNFETAVIIKVFFGLVFLITVLIIYLLFNLKVTITEKSVIRSSIFKSKEILFSDINSFNLYKILGKTYVELNEYDLNESNSYVTNIYLLISKNKDANPNSLFIKKDSFLIRVDQNIYQIIKAKLNE